MSVSCVRAMRVTMAAAVVALLLGCIVASANDMQASRAAASLAATTAATASAAVPTTAGLTVAAAADTVKPAVTVDTGCKCYGCSETEGYLGPQPLNNLLFQDLKAAKWEQDAAKHCPCCGPRASLYLNVTDGQVCASVAVLAPFRAAVMADCGQTSAVLKRTGLTLKSVEDTFTYNVSTAAPCICAMSGLVEAHRASLGGAPLTRSTNLEAQLTNLQRDLILYEAYCKTASILPNYVFSLQKNIDAIMALNGTAAPVACSAGKVVGNPALLIESKAARIEVSAAGSARWGSSMAAAAAGTALLALFMV